ncbi:hypothetical protein [Planomicrobium sp. CPCC 101079]|uniref:hypothetical protein n=1 Tax=Planomicrobium sp. CPCC 101079 TaxID=2599618 RepID=UPI001647787D|nr:hypothetical protein [Planomicrobium sp. CPCC 101079]
MTFEGSSRRKIPEDKPSCALSIPAVLQNKDGMVKLRVSSLNNKSAKHRQDQ